MLIPHAHMLQVGKLSTGDSLDMSPQDEASITANDATVKDMEVSSVLAFPIVIFLSPLRALVCIQFFFMKKGFSKLQETPRTTICHF